MDSGTIVISLIFFAVGAAFFLGISLSKKASNKKVLHDALQAVGMTPDGIGDLTMEGKMILGWVAGEKEFFFYRNSSNRPMSSRIRLEDVREVKLEKEVKSRPSANGNYSYINTIQLRIYPKHAGAGDTYLPLYKLDEDMQLGTELDLGRDWADRINSRLKG